MALTYQAIATVTVGSGGASSIDFTSIPQTYTDLVVLTSLRSNRAAPESGDWGIISFNGSTSNFTGITLDGYGSGVATYSIFPRVFTMGTAASATANTFGNGSAYIPNYTGSTNKSWSSDFVTENNATAAYADFQAGLWSDSAAITSISITPRIGSNWLQYSTATLYGIKNS